MARYTIDMDADFEKVLDSLAKDKGRTKAEIIRRAVASYSFLDQQVDPKAGTKVSITNQDDRVIKDVVLP